MHRQTYENPIIVALDVPSERGALELVSELSGAVGAFKIGLELFNAQGPSIFGRVQHAGRGEVRIFYDAKLHDIPNTVAGAMRAACQHNLWMINVHASGGADMMRAAVESASLVESRPLVIAVTVLTSIDTAVLNDELGVAGDTNALVVRLAKLAQSTGCDGVVASAHEVQAIRDACGDEFVIVTPGVRPAGSTVGDQKRVMTPEDALRAGSNHVVIGRPITQAKEPRKAAEAILAQIAQRASMANA